MKKDPVEFGTGFRMGEEHEDRDTIDFSTARMLEEELRSIELPPHLRRGARMAFEEDWEVDTVSQP